MCVYGVVLKFFSMFDRVVRSAGCAAWTAAKSDGIHILRARFQAIIGYACVPDLLEKPYPCMRNQCHRSRNDRKITVLIRLQHLWCSCMAVRCRRRAGSGQNEWLQFFMSACVSCASAADETSGAQKDVNRLAGSFLLSGALQGQQPQSRW